VIWTSPITIDVLFVFRQAALLFVLSACLVGAFAGDAYPSFPNGLFGKGYRNYGLGVGLVGKAVAAVPALGVKGYPAYPVNNGYGYAGKGYGAYPAAGYGYAAKGVAYPAYPAAEGYGAYPAAGYGYAAKGVAYPAYPVGKGYGAYPAAEGYGAYPAVGGYGYGGKGVVAKGGAYEGYPAYGGYGYGKGVAPLVPAVGVAKVGVAVPVAAKGKVGVNVGSPDPLAYDVFGDFSLENAFKKY